MMAVMLCTPALHAMDLSLPAAVDLALKNSPALDKAKAEHRAAVMDRKSVFGAFLPQVSVEGSIMGIKQSSIDPVTLPAGSFATTPIMIPSDDVVMNLMPSPDHSYGFSATVTQQLNHLFTIYQGYAMAAKGAELRRLNIALQENAVALSTVSAYFGAKMALAAVDVADSSLKLLDAHVTDAENFFSQGLITKGELLKIQMQQSKVRQVLLEAKQQQQLALSNLRSLLGLKEDAVLKLTEEVENLPGAPGDMAKCVEASQDKRLELTMLRGQADIARRAETSAYLQLMPAFLATMNYQYSNDGSSMTADHTLAGGLVLSWNIWDWGQTYYKAKSAGAQAAAARAGVAEVEKGVRLQVEQAWRNLKVEAEKIETARVRVDQAEENHRIEQESFAVQQSTATTLMDAENELQQARMELLMAHYGYHVALAGLKTAMGNFPIDRQEAPEAKE